jgi:hypothetical protein
MNRFYRWVSVIVVLLLIGMAMEPAAAQFYQEDDGDDDESRDGRSLSAPFRELASLVTQLMAVTTDTNDTDSDGLPDSVEWVIGTDHLNNDTDHDRLGDYEEVNLTLDPRSIDSNRDGIPDCFEVEGVVRDLDGDGVDNGWDWDNDDDGVVDSIDISPFAMTGTVSSFDLSINTSGGPTYVNLQLRTANPDNLRLMEQVWDWPDDDKGQMQDLDGSSKDVTVTPMLVFETDTALDPTAVAEYGMFVDDLTVYVPLAPVKDLGNTVAFNGRMFIPDQGGPVQVTGEIALRWLVTGYSDTWVVGLEAPGGEYVSVDETGVVRADSTELSAGAGLDITTSATGTLMLKAGNGRFLRVGTGSLVAATAIETDSACEFVKEAVGDGIVLRSERNKKYLSVDDSDGALYANVTTKADAAVFGLTEPWVLPKAITLAVYPEDFMLTGISVEENFGTDLGTFYGGSVEDLTAANLLLAYSFLRNTTTNVSDMPAILADEGINISYHGATFVHRDLAVIATTGEGLRDLIGDLPQDRILPITTIMEDRSTALELSELEGGSYIKGSSLSLDLGAHEVVATKILKTNWYDTSNGTAVETEEVLEALDAYGLTGESMLLLAALSIVWNVGEHRVVQVGDQSAEFETPDLENITDAIFNMVSYGLGSLSEAGSAIKNSYNYGTAFEQIKDAQSLSKLAKSGAVELTDQGLEQIDIAKSSLKNIKWANRVSKVLDWAGFIADIGIAVFTFIAMVVESGWNAAGVGSALVTSTLLLAYGLAVGWIAGMLGMAGPAGWVFAGTFLLLVAFAELISWLASDDSLSEWLVNKLVAPMTDQVERSTVSSEVIHENLTIDDRDGNGLDVGDRIQYNCEITSTVTAKRYSKPGIIRYRGPDSRDLDDSYLIITSYVYENGVKDERGNNGESISNDENIVNGDLISYKKHTTYELGPYIEPQAPAVNHQFTVVLGFDYKIIYWSCFAFIAWWCSRESHTDSFERDWITLYFDVMPASIDTFAGWTAITSNDRDGDGLNSTEETRSNAMLWDTDGDGLGDSYELTIGTDPMNADTDGDGVGDLLEIQLGTDAKRLDSDGEGLDDGMEYRGWVTSFNYSGEEFFWHVASDPRVADTDGDVVSDYLEYWSLLNPMSLDTDGDGLLDRAHDYWISEFAHDTAFDYSTESAAVDIEIDEDGYVYMLYQSIQTSFPWTVLEQGFYVYYPNGTVNTSWAMPTDHVVSDFDVGADGLLYVSFYVDQDPYRSIIRTYSRNGEPKGEYDNGFDNLWCLAVDTDNGHFYLGGMEGCQTVLQYDLSGNVTKMFSDINPTALELDGNGFLYAVHRRAGQYEVVKVDIADGTSRSFGATGSANGTFTNPYDVAVDSDGFILVADRGNHRVQKFDHLGRYVGQFNFTDMGNGTLDSPLSVCVDGDDNILVLEGMGNDIHRYVQSYIKIQVEQDQEFEDTDQDMLVQGDQRPEPLRHRRRWPLRQGRAYLGHRPQHDRHRRRWDTRPRGGRTPRDEPVRHGGRQGHRFTVRIGH